jgi:hypothetical protein
MARAISAIWEQIECITMRLRCAIGSLPLFLHCRRRSNRTRPYRFWHVDLHVSAASAFRRPAPSFCSGGAGKLISVLNPKKQRCRHAGHKLHESIENVISADFLGLRQKRDILYNNAAKFLGHPGRQAIHSLRNRCFAGNSARRETDVSNSINTWTESPGRR